MSLDYGSHGDGTFNVDPTGGWFGFYIGETNLYALIDSTFLQKTSSASTLSGCPSGAVAIVSGSVASNIWAGTAADKAALTTTNASTLYFSW